MENLRFLAMTFSLDLAWGLSYIYLMLEIYDHMVLMAYFLAISLGAIVNFLGTLIFSLIKYRRLISISIALSSSLLLYFALNNTNYFIMSTLLSLLSCYEPLILESLFGEMEEGEASGTYYTISGLGSIIGLLIGGFLVDSIGIKNLLLISSLVCLLSSIIVPDGINSEKANWEMNSSTISLLMPILILEGFVTPLAYNLLEIKLYEFFGRSSSLIGLLFSLSMLLDIIFGPLIGKLVDRAGGMISFLSSSSLLLAHLILCTLEDGIILISLLLIPIQPFYYSSRNKFAIELTGRPEGMSISLPIATSSLSHAIFYGIYPSLMNSLNYAIPLLSVLYFIALIPLKLKPLDMSL
jgi:MFS family permease